MIDAILTPIKKIRAREWRHTRYKKNQDGVYHVLPRAARAPGGLLWLRLHESSQELLAFLVSEGEISVGVQTEHPWPVDSRKTLDIRNVIVYLAGGGISSKRG